MYSTDISQKIKTARPKKADTISIYGADTGIASPFTNVSIVVVDSDNFPIEGVTAVVVEDTGMYQYTTANGVIAFDTIDRNHTIKFHYQGAELAYKVKDLPSQVKFTTEMLDAVYITNKPKAKYSWLLPIAIGLTTVAVFAQMLKEEKPLKVSL